MKTIQTFILLLLAALSAQAQLTVYPGPAKISINTTRQMSAYVPLSPNTVNWSINGTVGGNSTYGTVTQTGLYTAPPVVPPDNLITIQVTSTADAMKFTTAQISITQPSVNLWGVYPSTFAAGVPVTLSVNGSNIIPGAYLTIDGQQFPGVFSSSTKLTVNATFPAALAGAKKVYLVNPGNGATTSSSINVTIKNSNVQVSVSPSSGNVPVTGTQQFVATVMGNANTAVTWSATVGSISATGLFTAPNAQGSATIKATSVADPLVFASATVNITKPSVLVSVAPASAQLILSATQQFSATVTNAQNPAVTWTVNNIAGGNATVGKVDATGLYTAPAILPNPASVVVKAVSVEANTVFGSAAVTLKLQPPQMPNLSHARFLDQAAFGATAADLQAVGSLGLNGWLAQQFAMAETPIAMAADNNAAAQQYISRNVHAPDQLRQRMMNALHKIIVISANKNIYSNELVPYWQLLSKHAFGNYRNLLWEITVSPQMGKYLDLANSNKPGLTGGTNENYAREIMQLFALGLTMLNQDGTPVLDANNQAIPTYNQAMVAQVALALTGWTYPTAAGANPGLNNWENFSAPSMEVREQNHDTTAKNLLNGCVIPAGNTVMQATNAVVDCVFNHPNTGPFVVTRLIRDIVMSNPSPAYVQRVVNVWNNNGAGVKGDLKAVLTAILMDSEARNDSATVTGGRLKDSIYEITGFIRQMNGFLAPQNIWLWEFTKMGQSPMTPPSVFGFYPMLYRMPKSPLFGPEFQTYSPTEAVLRGNFIYNLILNPNGSDLKIDRAPFNAVAADPNALIDLANAKLLYGRMPQAMKTSLATAMATATDNNQRVETVLYLTALSGFYQVQF